MQDESRVSCLYQSKSTVLVCCVDGSALSISRMNFERNASGTGGLRAAILTSTEWIAYICNTMVGALGALPLRH